MAPRKSVDRKKINIYFQENVLEGLRRLAEARGTTYSELIREACRQYVVNESGKVIADNTILRNLTRNG